ncbi:MAG: 3-keto-5-aminohexanoate cleavage protein [Promethearchaeota archaeon]
MDSNLVDPNLEHSDLESKVVITAALSGAMPRKEQNPAVPYTPEEFAAAAARCREEGAAVCHVHARDPATGDPTGDLGVIGDTLRAIKARVPGMLVNLTTAIGPGFNDPEQRIAPVREFGDLIDLASLNTNSMNFTLADWKTGEVLQDNVFENRLGDVVEFARAMRDAGVKPEVEVYDFGGMYNVLFLLGHGLLEGPLHFQFVFGVLGGVPFGLANLARFLELKPAGATWSVCGVARDQVRAAMCAVASGGHVRVGLEDNLRMPDGKPARGSWEQVAWARGVVEAAGLGVANPGEARRILRL